MCLDWAGNNLKRSVRELEIREDGYVWLWKVFDLDKEDNLVGQFHKYDFYEGKNTAKGQIVLDYSRYIATIQYEPGFHCFLDKKAADDWAKYAKNTSRERVIVPVKVRKTWITTIGEQDSTKVVVCKHIII